jgi:hypothetical protein
MTRQCEAVANFTKDGKRCTNEAEISIKYDKVINDFSHKEFICYVCNEHKEVVLETIEAMSDLFLMGCLSLPEAKEKVVLT